MFITNELSPAEVLAELLKGRRLSVEATERFRALRHDKHLVPHFTAHIDFILEVYKAYRTDAHDIQGIRDDGIDVLLHYELHGVQSRVDLQIKSNDEFDQWANKKLNMLEKLKAQYSAAKENVRVDDYYIFLCCDDRVHRRRIRMICSELKNYGRCTAIEPRDAFGFYHLSGLDLVVRTTRVLCNTDVILRAALNEADAEEPDVAFFLISLVCHAFRRGPRINEATFSDLWSDWWKIVERSVRPNNRFSALTQALIGTGVLEEFGVDYVVDITQLPPGLCALFFDLQVRDLAPDGNIRDYMVGLLDIRDRALAEGSDEADDGSL